MCHGTATRPLERSELPKVCNEQTQSSTACIELQQASTDFNRPVTSIRRPALQPGTHRNSVPKLSMSQHTGPADTAQSCNRCSRAAQTTYCYPIIPHKFLSFHDLKIACAMEQPQDPLNAASSQKSATSKRRAAQHALSFNRCQQTSTDLQQAYAGLHCNQAHTETLC